MKRFERFVKRKGLTGKRQRAYRGLSGSRSGGLWKERGKEILWSGEIRGVKVNSLWEGGRYLSDI
jgi:hypothetical protein